MTDDAETFPFPALRARIAELHAQGREEERAEAADELARRLAELGGDSFRPAPQPLRDSA